MEKTSTMHKSMLWAVWLAILGGPALAAGIDCKNAPDQLSLNVCADQDYKASDAKLNEAYRALLAHVTKPGQAKLQKAQRAWVAYRDAQCDFDTMGSSAGSIYPMVHAACLSGLTQTQTKQLTQQLHCEEGDVSCGGQ
jgi:uncharacterized protein YecT (DUF1311 family)